MNVEYEPKGRVTESQIIAERFRQAVLAAFIFAMGVGVGYLWIGVDKCGL